MNKKFFPMTLIAVAILAGCTATTKSEPLTDAHLSYNKAHASPQINSLAPLELKTAEESLAKADSAASKGESVKTVNQLAYITQQQVAIAEETTKRKTAELAVANAAAQRDKLRLQARTAEADAARRDANAAQNTVYQQSEELAAANANAQMDQALIAQQEMQLRELNAQKTARGLVLTLGDVLFANNKAQIGAGGMLSVEKLAAFLNQYPAHKVLIEGHTDSTGSNAFNQKLSERRAQAVQLALLELGVSSERISANGYGEDYPVVANDTATNRQMNRRVEIIISDRNGIISPR